MTKKKSKRNSVYGVSRRSLEQLICDRRNSVFARNTNIPISEWAVEDILGALDEVDKEECIKVHKCSKSVSKSKSPEVYDENKERVRLLRRELIKIKKKQYRQLNGIIDEIRDECKAERISLPISIPLEMGICTITERSYKLIKY